MVPLPAVAMQASLLAYINGWPKHRQWVHGLQLLHWPERSALHNVELLMNSEGLITDSMRPYIIQRLHWQYQRINK